MIQGPAEPDGVDDLFMDRASSEQLARFALVVKND
jgi:hypothetical protein